MEQDIFLIPEGPPSQATFDLQVSRLVFWYQSWRTELPFQPCWARAFIPQDSAPLSLAIKGIFPFPGKYEGFKRLYSSAQQVQATYIKYRNQTSRAQLQCLLDDCPGSPLSTRVFLWDPISSSTIFSWYNIRHHIQAWPEDQQFYDLSGLPEHRLKRTLRLFREAVTGHIALYWFKELAGLLSDSDTEVNEVISPN